MVVRYIGIQFIIFESNNYKHNGMQRRLEFQITCLYETAKVVASAHIVSPSIQWRWILYE